MRQEAISKNIHEVLRELESKRGCDRDWRDRGLVLVGTRCGGLQLDANFLNSFESRSGIHNS